MPMVSNGMMFLATTENQRFVNFRQNMDFILKNVTEIKHINITVKPLVFFFHIIEKLKILMAINYSEE